MIAYLIIYAAGFCLASFVVGWACPSPSRETMVWGLLGALVWPVFLPFVIFGALGGMVGERK